MGFAEKFEEKVRETIKQYKLLQKEEKVAVAISGGKDSATALYLLKKFGYAAEALFIDLRIENYSEENLKIAKDLCEKLGVKLNVVKLDNGIKIKDCRMCGILKKWVMNKYARKLKAQKLVTGHNLDDEIETFLMNIFQGNFELNAALGPKPGLALDKKFVQRVKPLYFCTNEEIERYAIEKNIAFNKKSCPLSKNAFRKVVRKFIRQMALQNKNFKHDLANKILEMKSLFKAPEEKEVMYCKICGEPSRNEVCKRCKILKSAAAPTF
ncbi:MAG: hypothetical protein DRO04_02490 [Candidatus Iainarchaeum archaeon]|uniref:tRNA(Ile)-lysidine/2-thiocytidine synthase N-terminal domain-containing protein n=1 Tax=Candidatus Iainarchaeum sp. TaxID=3101447 RepID=A0A497JJB3_9ARCH|nr:MAG: hypothetical protein DRO04_02490 [Candidatus Diapherotrites archaeon]